MKKRRNVQVISIVNIIILILLIFFSCEKSVSEKENILLNSQPGTKQEQGTLPASDKEKDPNNIELEVSNVLLKLEYPEWHSFIYRYSKIRNEQLEMLKKVVEEQKIDVNLLDSTSLNNAGYSLYEQKIFADAIRFFREAAYLDPANVYAHYNLACSLSLLRDNIWNDPNTYMDYYNPNSPENDYYVSKYKLYMPSYDPNISDETCRDEIYDHLTLAALQDKRYLEKAPKDIDLKGIQIHLRFKRLMNNLVNTSINDIYGVYYAPQTKTKAVFFMLDGRIRQILVNQEVGRNFYLAEYDENDIHRYTFDDFITGYEYFASFEFAVNDKPQQWQYISPIISIYTLDMSVEYSNFINDDKIGLRNFDFSIYEKDYPLVRESFGFSLPDSDSTLIKFCNVFSYPYRAIIKEEFDVLQKHLESDTNTDIAMLVNLALVYDRYDILDWLIQHQYVNDLYQIMLTSSMYQKIDFFKKLEIGKYNFSMDSFLREHGDELFLYTAASGNVEFFEYLYKKYFDKLNEQQKEVVREEAAAWMYVTNNPDMWKITNDIEGGRYHVK